MSVFSIKDLWSDKRIIRLRAHCSMFGTFINPRTVSAPDTLNRVAFCWDDNAKLWLFTREQLCARPAAVFHVLPSNHVEFLRKPKQFPIEKWFAMIRSMPFHPKVTNIIRHNVFVPEVFRSKFVLMELCHNTSDANANSNDKQMQERWARIIGTDVCNKRSTNKSEEANSAFACLFVDYCSLSSFI